MRAVIILNLEGGSTGHRTESLVNWDGPMARVPCLHQGKIDTKRKLRVWRDQKCIPFVGAITPLNCAAVIIPRLEGGSIGPRIESCVFMTDLSPWYRVSTKVISIPKGRYGYGETRNVFR